VSVALISAVDPFPTDAGKKVVLAGFLEYFIDRYGADNVHYLKVGAPPQEPFPVQLHVVPKPPKKVVLRNIATKVAFGRSSLQEAFLGSPHTAAAVKQVLDSVNPKLHVYDTVRMAQYASESEKAEQICYLDDLFSERYDRMLRAARMFPDVNSTALGNFAEHIPRQLQPIANNQVGQRALLRAERALVRRSEDAAARAFRRCLLVNEEEVRILTQRAGIEAGRVQCVPPMLKAPASNERNYTGAPVFVFIGLLSLPHNDDGLRWFLRTTWPLLRSRLPEARLRIIGRDAGAEVIAMGARLSDSVTVEGYVPDLAEALGQAAAVINPLRFGSGIKLKVIEALGRAVPVVSTPIGAEGIANGAGTGVLVGSQPTELTDLLCSLTDRGRNEQVSDEARIHFARTYSRRAVFNVYDSAFSAP
jgi:glycosyltransferase involved in cell wall biosynthesis